ncbi:MAG: hypothetical protein V7K46_28280 [Nostoc sp.]
MTIKRQLLPCGFSQGVQFGLYPPTALARLDFRTSTQPCKAGE